MIENEAFKDVIILQTVLEELHHQSVLIYNRIRRLTADPTRRFYVFSNENHRQTFIDRIKLETPNDRNDRAIRVATQWYNTHCLAFSNVKFILLTDDAINRQLANQTQILNASVLDYVQGMTQNPDLIDIIAIKESISTDKKFMHKEYYSQLQITGGLKTGVLMQGVLSISMHNYLEASISATVDGLEMRILIIGRENMNRGIQGDTVVVEILPREQWSSLVEKEGILKDEENEENEDGKETNEFESDGSRNDSGKPVGKIVGIINRNNRPYCGTIEMSDVVQSGLNNQTQSLWFWALDKRIPKIRIRSRQAANLAGKRIVVAFDSWPVTSKHPLGHFVRVLGDVGEKKTETEVLLLEHDIPFTPFTPDVLASLPSEGENWIFEEVRDSNGREDFRYLDICSIDPPGCTDIDDALHARIMDNGNYEVGVRKCCNEFH